MPPVSKQKQKIKRSKAYKEELEVISKLEKKKYYVTCHQMLSVNLKKNPNKERIQTVLLQ